MKIIFERAALHMFFIWRILVETKCISFVIICSLMWILRTLRTARLSNLIRPFSKVVFAIPKLFFSVIDRIFLKYRKKLCEFGQKEFKNEKMTEDF